MPRHLLPRPRTISWLALALSWLLWSAHFAAAQQDAPLSFQTVVFRKIFSFDRALTPTGIRMTVVYSAGEKARAASVVEAFRAAGIGTDLSLGSELGVQLSSVLYVLPGADMAAVKKFCIAHRALSIGPNPSMVKQGQVALSLELGDGGHAEIWANLSRLKEEQHEIDSGLLRLANIVP